MSGLSKEQAKAMLLFYQQPRLAEIIMHMEFQCLPFPPASGDGYVTDVMGLTKAVIDNASVADYIRINKDIQTLVKNNLVEVVEEEQRKYKPSNLGAKCAFFYHILTNKLLAESEGESLDDMKPRICQVFQNIIDGKPPLAKD